MELPAALRRAVDAALAGTPVADLAAAAQTLSERYRSETRDGALHISGDLAARAYLATRMPATYAAISAVFASVAEMRPDFAPRSLLDIGAGPGTAMWAAAQTWPVADATLLERSGAIRSVGEMLSVDSGVGRIVWDDVDLSKGFSAAGADLTVIAYVLNEIPSEARGRLIAAAWSATTDMLIIAEPGTPAGWRRILQARGDLLTAGAHIVAPCPHETACPLSEPDWCHFSRRVSRARIHRLAKGAEMPWEDEKFIFLAVSRVPAAVAVRGRVIAPPQAASGRVGLKLCCRDGGTRETRFTRRDGAAYKMARRLDWGDVLLVEDQP